MGGASTGPGAAPITLAVAGGAAGATGSVAATRPQTITINQAGIRAAAGKVALTTYTPRKFVDYIGNQNAFTGGQIVMSQGGNATTSGVMTSTATAGSPVVSAVTAAAAAARGQQQV